MTEERNKWAVSLVASMKRCADPKMPCDGCLFDHVCDHQEENGTDIMLSGAAMIEELLTEVNYLNTVKGHLKEMAGNCPEKPDSSDKGVSKGEAWQLGLYERVIAKYGEEKQVTKAIEELGELSVELSRSLIAGGVKDEHLLANIREELADVCIMTDQLQLIFGDVSDWEMHKLERLERKLERGL